MVESEVHSKSVGPCRKASAEAPPNKPVFAPSNTCPITATRHASTRFLSLSQPILSLALFALFRVFHHAWTMGHLAPSRARNAGSLLCHPLSIRDIHRRHTDVHQPVCRPDRALPSQPTHEPERGDHTAAVRWRDERDEQPCRQSPSALIDTPSLRELTLPCSACLVHVSHSSPAPSSAGPLSFPSQMSLVSFVVPDLGFGKEACLTDCHFPCLLVGTNATGESRLRSYCYASVVASKPKVAVVSG